MSNGKKTSSVGAAGGYDAITAVANDLLLPRLRSRYTARPLLGASWRETA